ncbi:MAG: helix-turn-helix domain-containing protein [Pseudomonadales bacterium]|nr:helix-turn-helix domain-containing protein [Pseudomonadales bacterium]
MFKATKVRLYPTSDQRRALAFQFGAMRWAYNFALHWRSEAWSARGERIRKRMTLDRLVELKVAEETTWLKEADSQALQQAVIHLDVAFKRFFTAL